MTTTMATATTASSSWRWSWRKPILPIKIKLHQPQHQVNNVVIVANSNAKRANLSASRIQRINLPVYDSTSTSNDAQAYHISRFLTHPSGIEAILNTSALQNFQFLDTNAYRCTLPKLQLFNFEATPVLDLRVIPTLDDCTVELFSCKFKGSKVVERQNDNFSATMINHITWDTNISEPFLEVDVKLNLSLEIYTRPLILLPISAFERPGNLYTARAKQLLAYEKDYHFPALHLPIFIPWKCHQYRMIQALVDRLVPLLLQQLVQDYNKWVHRQTSKFLMN